MYTYDQQGNVLGTLPADAVRVRSSLLMLSGKYVDSDGIVYDADGSLNEPATSAYAREIAAGRIAAAYSDYTPTPEEVKKDSVQENSNAEGSRMYWDSMFDNIYTTASEIPGRVANVAASAGKIGFDAGKWIVIGLVAYAVIKVMDRVPSRGHVKRYAQKRIRSYRRQLARHVGG